MKDQKRWHKKAASAESGQALILIAILMVALIGMLGLVIDGGRVIFLHRDTQNAVDAGILAANYARCTGGDIVIAAEGAVRENGFEHNGETVFLEINSPPLNGQAIDDPNFIEISLNAHIPSYFIHLVFGGQLEATSRSVGSCTPPFNPFTVPAIWAGSTVCQNTVDSTGADVYIESMAGRAIHSNNEVKIGGGGQTNVIIGDTTAVSTVESSNTTFSPEPITGVEVEDPPLPFLIEEFMPGGDIAVRADIYHAYTSPADDVDYKSNGTWQPANGRTIEGLYYVDGNVDIGNNVDVGPEGLTIAATGAISFSGGSDITYYIDGVLLFTIEEAQNCGENSVSLSGAENLWTGVIYAPYSGVSISNSNMTAVGAIVADNVTISGSDLDLIYDPDILDPRPPRVRIIE